MLPYVFLSVFADVVHVHAATAPARANGTPHTLSVGAAKDVPSPTDPECPLCLWLRAGSRLTSLVSLETDGTAVHSWPEPATDNIPISPVPLPRAFRGPPSSTLS